MGRVMGKVALITGAARGQGRSHAVRLAQEGADIVALDICADLDTVPYSCATADDLATTTKLVEDTDRRVISRQVDVRDSAALRSVADEAVAEFGHIDVVCANAGIASAGRAWELSDETWQEMIDVNLTGVWKTAKAVIPHMLEHSQGGSVIITSSAAGLAALPNIAHYTTAKHGLVGLTRVLAVELAPYGIRVNSVHPTSVDTPMFDNAELHGLFLPDVKDPSKEQVEDILKTVNALPIPWVETTDVSNAVLFLASDESRYITGIQLPVDAGALMPFKVPTS